MFLFCVFKNLWDRLFLIESNNKELFGFGAENILQKFLIEKNYKVFFNRILKSPYNKNHFLEIDAICYHNNTIFCIEMKNYKGTVYYAANFKNDTFDSYKKNKIIQLKTDKHLNQTYKELPNPLYKTTLFTKQLRKYLLRLDNRFSTIKFISVVVFLNLSTNIDNIRSFNDGIIYLSELDKFLDQKSGNEKNNSWAAQILEQLPSFDKIITINNQTIQGIIKNNIIACHKPNIELQLKNIKTININHTLTSCKSQLKIEYVDFTTSEFECQKLFISLDKFGTIQTHRLSNIKKIIVGTHTLRPF